MTLPQILKITNGISSKNYKYFIKDIVGKDSFVIVRLEDQLHYIVGINEIPIRKYEEKYNIINEKGEFVFPEWGDWYETQEDGICILGYNDDREPTIYKSKKINVRNRK